MKGGNNLKRLILISFILSLLFSTVSVSAEPSSGNMVVIEESDISSMIGSASTKEVLVSHILNLKSEMLSFSVTQESKLYILSCITKMYKDLYYLCAIDQLDISSTELEDIIIKVRIEADTFVKKYGVSEKLLFSEINTEQSSDIKEMICSELKQIIEDEIPSIVESELTPLIENNTEDDYSFLITKYQETLYWSNEILDSIVFYQDDLASLKENDNYMEQLISNLLSTFRAKQILENKEIEKLLQAAKDFQPSIKRESGSISVKQDTEYQLESLASVKRKENWNDLDFSLNAWEFNSSIPELELSYIAMLASTSVYTPFRSHVGDEDYIEALKSLAATGEQDKLVALFNRVKDKRKPLYYSTPLTLNNVVKNIWGSSYSNYTGVSYRATLGDLIRFAEDEIDTMFFTVRGSFQAEADINSWGFYQAPQVTQSGETVKFSTTSQNGVSISADKSVSTENYTKTLFEIGSSPGTYSLGLMLFQNSYYDLRNTAFLEDKKDSLLYVNIFGDIVLSDNTVIIPGAANPLIYSPDSAYNPYTVAFINSYPRVAQDVDSIRIQSKNDFNKYMLFVSHNLFSELRNIFSLSFSGSNNIIFTEKQVQTIDKFDYKNLEIRKIRSNSDFSPGISKRSISLYPFFYGGNENFFSFARFSYTDDVQGFNLYGITQRFLDDSVALTFEQVLTSDKVTLFPYHRDENNSGLEDSFKVPKYIAQNMYWYFVHDTGTGKLGTASTANKNLRSDYIYENLLVEMLQGSEYVTAFEKNINIDNIILGEGENPQLSGAKNIANSLLSNIGEIDGVLGIVSADTNPVFGKLLQFFREYSIYVFCFFIVIFIFRYMRRGDFLYIIVMSTISGIFLYLFLFIVPTFIPFCYNSIGSMFTEKIVSDTLLYKAESYSTTYAKSSDSMQQNNYDIQTVSMTLYRLSEKQLREFSEKYNIAYDSLRYGDRIIIDPNIGLFLQGNLLKINVDVLLYNNPITGSYIGNDTMNYYHLTSDKKTSSVLDFYCPFYQIEDGFVDTLNSFLRMYNIPRTTIDYIDGLVKDSYIVFNYTNSIPFLYHDKMFEAVDLTPIEYMKLEEAFPNPTDFLNLSEWINNPTEKMKESLWFKTMVENGYYDPTFGEERRQDLITYVNYQTRRYLIENQPLIGLVSDENLIKIISLEATFFFNSRISDTGNWVYPVSFNQEELKLNDVFLTALTTDNDRFVKHNFDIIGYIGNSYGVLGVILLIIILFVSLILVTVIKFSFPFLYVVLALLVIYRFLFDKPIGDLIKSYFKVTVTIISIYTFFIVILSCIPNIVSGITMLVVLALSYLLLCFCLFIVFIDVFKDIINVGNNATSNTLNSHSMINSFKNPFYSTFDRVTTHRFDNKNIYNEEYMEDRDMANRKRHQIMRMLDKKNIK